MKAFEEELWDYLRNKIPNGITAREIYLEIFRKLRKRFVQINN